MKLKLSIDNYQLSILLLLFFASPLKAQVAIGEPASSSYSFSLLELSSAKVKGGLRLPQLTTTERGNLDTSSDAAAAQGLLIYNSDPDKRCIEFLNSDRQWVSISNDNPRIFFTLQGGNPLNKAEWIDPTKTTFSAAGGVGEMRTLVPHDNPECNLGSPYTTVSVKVGSLYTQIGATANTPTNGEFTVTMAQNTSTDSRYAIITVTDNCMNQSQDFILVQVGTSN